MFPEEQDLLPEQKLWRAVLCQALYDALSDFKNQMLIEDGMSTAIKNPEMWIRDVTTKLNHYVDLL